MMLTPFNPAYQAGRLLLTTADAIADEVSAGRAALATYLADEAERGTPVVPVGTTGRAVQAWEALSGIDVTGDRMAAGQQAPNAADIVAAPVRAVASAATPALVPLAVGLVALYFLSRR